MKACGRRCPRDIHFIISIGRCLSTRKRYGEKVYIILCSKSNKSSDNKAGHCPKVQQKPSMPGCPQESNTDLSGFLATQENVSSSHGDIFSVRTPQGDIITDRRQVKKYLLHFPRHYFRVSLLWFVTSSDKVAGRQRDDEVLGYFRGPFLFGVKFGRIWGIMIASAENIKTY